MINFGYGVKLAPLNPENLDTYRRNRNDWSIRRWCRQTGLIDKASQVEWFHSAVEDPAISMFEMWDGVKNRFVGVCGLTDLDPWNRRAEFSLYVNPEAQGAQYGYQGLKTLVEYGFKDLGLNLIWGETVGANPAEKTFRRVGFVSTGYKPQYYFKDGKWHDSHMYFLECSTYMASLQGDDQSAKVTHLPGTTT